MMLNTACSSSKHAATDLLTIGKTEVVSEDRNVDVSFLQPYIKTKSKNIVGLAKALMDNYNGEVPNDYDALVSLPGVGRKTANVVLSVGFGEQRIAVDTHVFRASNRIGLVHESDVLKTEEGLMRAVPHDRWSESHHSLIFHGRNCCHARKPNCDGCCISKLCEKNNL